MSQTVAAERGWSDATLLNILLNAADTFTVKKVKAVAAGEIETGEGTDEGVST